MIDILGVFMKCDRRNEKAEQWLVSSYYVTFICILSYIFILLFQQSGQVLHYAKIQEKSLNLQILVLKNYRF